MDKNSKSVVIRRYVAIGLTLLTILFLFWPSVIIINRDSDAWEPITKYTRKYNREEYSRLFSDDWAKEYRRHSTVSAEDMKLAKEAGLEVYDLMEDDDYNASIFRLRGFVPKLMRFAGDEDGEILSSAFTIILNSLFFTLIGLAVASALMMLFNQSRVFGILHVVLAFLTAAAFLVLGLSGVIAKNAASSHITISPVYPGAATFLLPAFALAAVIVYKRVKPGKAALKAAVPDPQPVHTQQTFSQQPINPMWNQQPAEAQPQTEANWTCPSCNANNPASDGFCSYCGTKRP